MKILVTNPTGHVGWRVLTELLAPEFSVRVIARDPSRLPEDIRDQIEIVRGSADDAGTLRGALDGVEALFWCAPNAPLHEVNVRAHYERFALAGCQAIRGARTARVVTISAAGNVLGPSAGPISGLHAMEDILDQSGAALRHLRCGWLMENLLGQAHRIREHGVLAYPIRGHLAVPITAAKDIADVALRWLVRRDWGGTRRVAVYGPEDLSFNQTAAIMERFLDKPVRYTEVSADDYVRRMVRSGASVHYARSEVAMFAALPGVPRLETRTAAESTTSTTLAAWTRSELLPLVKALSPRAEPEAALAGIGKTQSEIPVLADGRFLEWFGVARARPNELPLYGRGRASSRTKGIARPCSVEALGRGGNLNGAGLT